MMIVRVLSMLLVLAGFASAQSNPVPLVDLPLVPSSVAPGGGGLILTVNGAGFVPGATVNWNGSQATTTFVSSSQLTAVIAAGNVAKAGTAIVSVANPTPGGGTSNLELFTVGTPTSGSALAFAQINELGIANAEHPNASGMAVTGDWNNDGKLDIAWSETDNFSFGYLLNVLSNGDGTFQAPVIEEPGPGYNFGTVLAGDFNNDGKPDLVVDSTASAKFPMNYTNLA